MISKTELENMFQNAVEAADKPTPLKELTSAIINVERKYVYGEASLNNRLKLIRELIELSRQKGDIC